MDFSCKLKTRGFKCTSFFGWHKRSRNPTNADLDTLSRSFYIVSNSIPIFHFNFNFCRLDILGWFHSHPTFAPEPSQQDLDTQQMVQQWIGNSNPCIGIILSPFSLNGALIASPYRCMIVNKKNNFEDQFVPYKFHVEVISENFVVLDFLREIRRILKCGIAGNKMNRVDFLKPYTQDNNVSFMEKVSNSLFSRMLFDGKFSYI